MTTFQDLEQLQRPKGSIGNILGKVWNLSLGVGKFFLAACIFTQCTSLSILADKVEKLESRPAVAQFGKERTLILGESLTEEENLELFVKESLPLLYSITPFAPKDSDPKCSSDPNCTQALSKGIEIAGIRGVPTIPGMSSYLLSESYQRPFLKTLNSLKPKNFDRGASLLYRVNDVGKPTKTQEGIEVYVTGSLFGFDANQTPLRGIRDDKLVTLRPIQKPTAHDELTDLHKLINATRSRGWEITQITSVELEN